MKLKTSHIIICIIVILIIVAFLIFSKNGKNNETKAIAVNNIQITSFNIENRTSHIKDNVIYVGNNIKEIENGFYDLKIINNDGVEIYLNKLWYENYDNDYIQDEYLAKICREIVNRLNIDCNKEELEYTLYKYIKDNYLNTREGKTVSKLSLEDLEISLVLSESIPKLEIKRSIYEKNS